jgi:hypothetical protein
MALAAQPTAQKPEDIQDGSFPPISLNNSLNREVLVFNVPQNDLLLFSDSLTFSIEGSDLFQVTGGTVFELNFVKSPFELPGHVAVFDWEEQHPRPFDGKTPLTVSRTSRIHVFVSASVPSGEGEPGAFTGTLVVSGQKTSLSVPLDGFLLSVAAKTPIGQKWESLGGDAFFGEVLTNAHPTPDSNGTMQEFANGALWDTGQGVFYLSKLIHDKWASPSVQSDPGPSGETAARTLGIPREDTLGTAEGGEVLFFQGGSIVARAGQPPSVVLAGIADLPHVRDQIVINDALNESLKSFPGSTIRLIARQVTHEAGVSLRTLGRDVLIVADTYDGSGGSIDTRGASAEPGNPGLKGPAGRATSSGVGNQPGGTGAPGSAGNPGSPGASARLICQKIVNALVVAPGNNGGTGGVGGTGGDGGDGARHGGVNPEIIEGTSGGNGGPGGPGGPGGRGGQVAAIFMDASATPILEVPGGPGGAGGAGGTRGVKGAFSPDDDSKPGPAGPQGVTGASGTARNIQVDANRYWGSVQAELGNSSQDWAKHRLEVGKYFYRQASLTMALQEFDAVLRLDPQNADALRLKQQILTNQNILGLALDLDLIPDFQTYSDQFKSLAAIVTEEFNTGIEDLLSAETLVALTGQVSAQVDATKTTLADTKQELTRAVAAQSDANDQLNQARTNVAEVRGQIQAALSDMNNHSISFGDVVGIVGEVGGAVLSIAAAIPSGGTSLAALVPDVIALGDSLSENAGPIVNAVFQPETGPDGGANIDAITKAYQNLNQDASGVIGDVSSVVNFVSLIDNLGHAVTDNPQYTALLQRGAQVIHEQYLAEKQVLQTDQAVNFLTGKVNDVANLLTETMNLFNKLTQDEKVIRDAGLRAIRSAQGHIDIVQGYAFRAQRSVEISKVKADSFVLRLDAGYISPDMNRDFAEGLLGKDKNDGIAKLVAEYQQSWSLVLNAVVDLQTEYTNFFISPERGIDVATFSFTAPEILQAFRDNHDLSFSFAFDDLSNNEFEATIQNVFVSFVGATSLFDFVPCIVSHSGRYEQKKKNGEIAIQLLQPQTHNVQADVVRLKLAGVNFTASTTPLTAAQGINFWGRGAVGIWGVSIDADQFRLKHVDLTNMSEIQVLVGYQFSK